MSLQRLDSTARREAKEACPSDASDASRIEISQVRGRSRMTRCKSISPLKILNPTSISACCQAYLSSYGGGMVAGDSINLEVSCLPGSKFFLGTQAETKIFTAHGGNICVQNITGRLGDGALAAGMRPIFSKFAGSPMCCPPPPIRRDPSP